jgi:hypothetical protein
VIPDDRAVAVDTWVERTAAAREETARLAGGRDASVDNGALEFPVLAHELAADGPAIELALSPAVIAPITRYLGLVPILYNAFVTRAHTTELLENTAHLFHLDPEDTRSMKLFVHLTDVDEGCGPLHVLPAATSERVLETVGYKGVDKVTDERMAELGGWDDVVQVLGPAGTIALADTTRCLHFGGRPRDEGKPLREMLVVQYLLPTSLIVQPDGEGGMAKPFFPQLAATGDDLTDALLGRRFV